jgi:hypothetical protein
MRTIDYLTGVGIAIDDTTVPLAQETIFSGHRGAVSA